MHVGTRSGWALSLPYDVLCKKTPHWLVVCFLMLFFIYSPVGQPYSLFWFVTTQAKPPRRLLFLMTCNLVSICVGYTARNGGPGPSTWLHDNNIVYKVVVPVDVPPRRAKVLPRIHPHQQVVLSDFLTFANLVGANGISLLF